MNQTEIAISAINGLRIIIAQKPIVALNDHWNVAAFGNTSLNYRMILQLVKLLKIVVAKFKVFASLRAPLGLMCKVKNVFLETKTVPPSWNKARDTLETLVAQGTKRTAK